MPNNLPGYQSVDDPKSALRPPGRSLFPEQGLITTRWSTRLRGRSKMYMFGEEMSLVDSNSNYVQDGFTKLNSSSFRYFLQPHM